MDNFDEKACFDQGDSALWIGEGRSGTLDGVDACATFAVVPRCDPADRFEVFQGVTNILILTAGSIFRCCFTKRILGQGRSRNLLLLTGIDKATETKINQAGRVEVFAGLNVAQRLYVGMWNAHKRRFRASQ